ncbi:type I restriction system specificity protein [Micromonospora fulviviridis]|uniref:restriction endonuclease subunit S n=1 Tax=Micromonospora fulviviridis TaxID=47860 RepID=UPI0019CB6DA6|nr:restriction endonuclease subunit S [Micromonospora fulviviridis]GGR77839.1 type I restriction system specificity protein [Micromonospora fulviviridis]
MPDRTTTFSELVSERLIEIGAGRPRTVNMNGQDLPILRVADVLDGRVEYGFQARMPNRDVQGQESKVSRPGDIVLTTKGTVGRVALMPPDGPAFAYSPQLCFFRPTANGPLRSRFLYYWFKSAEFWIQANALKGQTDMADFLSLGDLQRLRISIPPLDRQDAVVDVLGALDDKIAVNDRIAGTLDGFSAALFEQATRQRPQIPLSDIANPVLGATPDRAVSSYWGGTVPWASAKDIANSSFGVVATTEEHITEEAAQMTRAKPVPSRSVVLTARGTVGAVARVVKASSFNQSCYAFIPGQIPPAVLFHIVRMASDRMLSIAHGTVFSTVNMKTFSHVGVPSITDAQLPALEGRLAPLHRGIEQRLLESMTLRRLRDTLLPELMSGRLRVRHAEKVVEEAI